MQGLISNQYRLLGLLSPTALHSSSIVLSWNDTLICLASLSPVRTPLLRKAFVINHDNAYAAEGSIFALAALLSGKKSSTSIGVLDNLPLSALEHGKLFQHGRPVFPSEALVFSVVGHYVARSSTASRLLLAEAVSHTGLSTLSNEHRLG